MDFQNMKEFIFNNLKGCSKDVLEWHSTALVPSDSILKEAALILIQDNPDVLLCDALSFAERYTVQFALRQVAFEVEN